MSQFQTFSSADLKIILRDITGQDYNETVIIAVQKLFDVIYANNKSGNLVDQRDGKPAASAQSRGESSPLPSPPIVKDEVLVPVDKDDTLVAEARRKVQGCLHSAIYDLYVYQNHTTRNYKVLFRVREITPAEVAILEKMGGITESFMISPFSDGLWNVRFDFDRFI